MPKVVLSKKLHSPVHCRTKARSYIHHYIPALHIPPFAYIMGRALKLWVEMQFQTSDKYKLHLGVKRMWRKGPFIANITIR
jgi:hypothetical protein